MKKTTMLMAMVAVGAGMLFSANVSAYSRIFNTETNNYKANTPDVPNHIDVDGVVEDFGRASNRQWRTNESRNSVADRLRIYWSKKNRTREDKYIPNQRFNLMLKKRSINVNDSSTWIDRSGEMQTQEGVQQFARQRVEAVNAKAVFAKRAKDYYINGGYAGTDVETMSRGNKDGETMRANRAWYFSPEYMMERGFINYVAKDPLRYLNTWEKELGAGQQNMYNYKKQNAGMSKVGITPYTLPTN